MESATKSNDVRASLGDPPNTRTEANLVSRVPCRRMSARNAMAGGFSCEGDSRFGGVSADESSTWNTFRSRTPIRCGSRWRSVFSRWGLSVWAVGPRGRWIVAVLIFPGIVTVVYRIHAAGRGSIDCGGSLFGLFAAAEMFVCTMGGTVARDRAAHRFCGAFKSRKRVPADKGRGTLPGIGPRHTLEPRSQCSGKIITAATTQPPYVYDQRVRRASTIGQYLALMNEADEEAFPCT